MKMKNTVVTAALPYANGELHIGHIKSTYLPADVYYRFLKLKGENAIYICAADTHGTPIEIKAKQAGRTIEDHINHYRQDQLNDFHSLDIIFSNFHTSHSEENRALVNEFLEGIKNKNLLEKKIVDLFYCGNCERFLPDRYIKGECPKCNSKEQYGDGCEDCGTTYNVDEVINPHCSECGTEPKKMQKEHFIFKLSEFSGKLKNYLEKNQNLKEEVKNFALKFIDEGLRDWDITRDNYWGFDIPFAKGQQVYVWFDAPLEYIGSTINLAKRQGKPDLWKEYWLKDNSEIVHFIGKDIMYHHLLFWPAMLMANNYRVPDKIPVRGFMKIKKGSEESKMSKSKGILVSIKEFLAEFPADFLRFYQTWTTPDGPKDTVYSKDGLVEVINGEFINKVCNFVNRNLKFVEQNYSSKIPESGQLNEQDKEFIGYTKRLGEKVADEIARFNLDIGLKRIVEGSSFANKYIESKAPWRKINDDPKDAKNTIYLAMEFIKDLAILLSPYVPRTSERIYQMLNLNKRYSWKDIGQFRLNPGHQIGKVEILYPRIEEKEKRLLSLESEEETIDTVTFNEWSKLNIKIGEIKSVEEHPRADKLYVMKVDLGNEERTVIAGLKPHYKKEELIGKQLPVITNLEPRTLKGIKSEGMGLAVVGEDIVLLSPEKRVKNGARVE